MEGKVMRNIIDTYILDAVFVQGSIGDVPSLFPLLKKKMRKKSVHVYLATVAAADEVFLLREAKEFW